MLTITQMLREYGVVEKFVEYFGPGIGTLSVPDRATISNMTPEYGATVGFFPVDEKTIEYLRKTDRESRADLVEAYSRANGLFMTGDREPEYSDVLELDLASVRPCVAGPARPQDRIVLADLKSRFADIVGCRYDRDGELERISQFHEESGTQTVRPEKCLPLTEDYHEVDLNGRPVRLSHGSIVIAAITSCTNTSNPHVLLGAGLLARNAVRKGLKVPAYVKTSLAPGSKVVHQYLEDAGMMPYFEALGFHLTAFGCTTCIGNSGPLHPAIEQARGGLRSERGGRSLRKSEFRGPDSPANQVQFPGFTHAGGGLGPGRAYRRGPDLRAGRPGSQRPAGIPGRHLAGERGDRGPDGASREGRSSSGRNTAGFLKATNCGLSCRPRKASLTPGTKPPLISRTRPISRASNRNRADTEDVEGGRVLAVLGDTVTTDHISPAGAIPKDYPAGRWLIEKGVDPADFNSYGSRRGNHEVMMRGTFGNIRLKNRMVEGREGSYTLKQPEGEERYIYEAARAYASESVPLIVLGGREYGAGSSRDWAAKGRPVAGRQGGHRAFLRTDSSQQPGGHGRAAAGVPAG